MPSHQSHPRWLTVMAATFVSIPAIAQAISSEGAAKAAIGQLEQRWVDALDAADLRTIGAILGDDFVRPAPQSGRFITKAQLMAYYRSHLKLGDRKRHIEGLTVSVYGNTAIARGTVVIDAADGRPGSSSLFTDVFVRRNGCWQAVSAQENERGQHPAQHEKRR